MMAICRSNVRDMLLPGLAMSPEERRRARERVDEILAAKAAAERAHYEALSATERAEYDALTEGMMPHISRGR